MYNIAKTVIIRGNPDHYSRGTVFERIWPKYSYPTADPPTEMYFINGPKSMDSVLSAPRDRE